MNNSEKMKVGEIVTINFRAAEVFKKAGIDFCCGGQQTLEMACRNRNLDIKQLQSELEALHHTSAGVIFNFNEWSLDFLCDYIVNNHHHTVHRLIPELREYTIKIASVHGANHPELPEIAQLFDALSNDLLKHLKQEEEVLFPAIKEVLKTNNAESKQLIWSEICRMQTEHEFAGSMMDKINRLSTVYALPLDACNTYRVTYKLLEQFEDDLHVHVHLENNILYPKALNLTK